MSECPRCGQSLLADAATVCEPCRKADRAPQGEAFGLFDPTAFNTPAPAPRGQGGLF